MLPLGSRNPRRVSYVFGLWPDVTQLLGQTGRCVEVTKTSGILKHAHTLVPGAQVVVVRVSCVRHLIFRSDIEHDIRAGLCGH